jgi:hypothetical protein
MNGKKQGRTKSGHVVPRHDVLTMGQRAYPIWPAGQQPTQRTRQTGSGAEQNLTCWAHMDMKVHSVVPPPPVVMHGCTRKQAPNPGFKLNAASELGNRRLWLAPEQIGQAYQLLQ